MADGEELDAAFLARIIASLPFALFVKDRAFRYVIANDALRSMTGDPSLALVGHTDFEVLSERDAATYRRSDLAAVEAGGPVVEEQLFVDAHGRDRSLETTKVPLEAKDGEGVTHVIGVVHDITDLKRAEDSLRVANEALEVRVFERTRELEEIQATLLRKERLAVVGELASALAHQIRNPLGAISNASYVLSRALQDHKDPNVARAIAIVHEEAWRANRIIGDLLDYARIRPAMRVRASPSELLDRALFAQRVPEGKELDVGDLAGLPSIFVDDDQVVRALQNLLRNALESAGSSGTVRVVGRLDGPCVEIEICDASAGGAGAAAGEPPVRASEPPPSEPPLPTTTKPLDVALGLATARALVENQGGSVELSPEGARARFLVRLPVDDRAEPPPDV
jgi:PAS domain S-box-containing protein